MTYESRFATCDDWCTETDQEKEIRLIGEKIEKLKELLELKKELINIYPYLYPYPYPYSPYPYEPWVQPWKITSRVTWDATTWDTIKGDQ